MISFKEYLTEAKQVLDLRHDKFSAKDFFGSKKDSEYIHPRDGFHFTYHNGNLILHSTNNNVYDAYVVYGELPNKAGYGVKVNYPSDEYKQIMSASWNKFSGLVDLRAGTVTISKVSVQNKLVQRISFDIKQEQAALRELKRFGVTDSFKLKGFATDAKTVGEFLSKKSAVDSWAQGKSFTFYHGTSAKRAALIQKNGLQPGHTPDDYYDLVKGYSEYNVYLATNPKTAEFYGKRQARKDGDSEYVIFKIQDIDINRIVADDSMLGWGSKVSTPDRVKMSLTDGAEGQVGYRGTILPSKLSIFRKGRV